MRGRIESQRPSRRRAASLAFGVCFAFATALLAVPGFAGSQLALSPWGAEGRDYALRFVLPPARLEPAERFATAAAVEPTAPPPEIVIADAQAPVAVAQSQPAAEPAKLPVPTARLAAAKLPGVMALSYTIGARPDGVDAIEIEKPVWVGGAEAGRLALRIDATSRLYAQGRAIAALLAESGKETPALADAFISFHDLRELGIELRYDPVHDRLVLAAPAAEAGG